MIETKDRPTIVVTLGDPAGVGAEVTLKALAHEDVRSRANWILFGDQAAVHGAEQSTGVQMESLEVDFRDFGLLPPGESVQFGALRADYGAAAARYVSTLR